MGDIFSYTLLREWSGADDPQLALLAPHQRLLLFSDGSMTLDLELLFNSRVEVEVRFKGRVALGPEGADYLGAVAGEEALEREVWLRTGKKRLVYAHTLIPLSCIDKSLLKTLEENGEEPLGRVLAANRVFFSKERLEAGFVRCPQAARDLGVSGENAFAARRYILLNRVEGGRYIIKASVTEVFSPGIIPGPASAGVKP